MYYHRTRVPVLQAKLFQGYLWLWPMYNDFQKYMRDIGGMKTNTFVHYCIKGYLEIIKMASSEINKKTECK